MKKKKSHSKRKKKQNRSKVDLIESDEYFAFIVGYTEGGAPYGITNGQWNEIEEPSSELKEDIDDSDLPF